MLKGRNLGIARPRRFPAIRATDRPAAPLARASRQLRDASERQAQTLADIQQAAARIKESVQSLAEGQAATQEVWQQYEKRFSGVDASLNEVFDRLSEGLASYCQQVNAFADELDKTTAGSVDKLSGAVAELRDALEGLEDWLPRSGLDRR